MLLILCPELGAESPVWASSWAMVELTGPILRGLPRDLHDELVRWAEVAWEEDSPELAEEGRRLRQRFQDELGPGFEVRLEPD